MTFNEFKSWLDGFSEAIGEAPTPEQWARVKAKMGEVDKVNPFPFQLGSAQSIPLRGPILEIPLCGPRYDTAGTLPSLGLGTVTCQNAVATTSGVN